MTFYRGKEGHWAWVFHRLTGLGVLLFLLLHIVDTLLVGWGPEVYNKMIEIYRNPVFKLGEIGLFAAVLYHALNGVRIILIDFWPGGARHHKKIFYAAAVIFAVSMAGVSARMLGLL